VVGRGNLSPLLLMLNGSVALEALDAVYGCCTRGLSFEVGAVDNGVGGDKGNVITKNKRRNNDLFLHCNTQTAER